MCDILSIANRANLIVNGYAFTKNDDTIQVLNLNKPDKATLLSSQGEVLETSMDDIELEIMQDYLNRNRRFLEG